MKKVLLSSLSVALLSSSSFAADYSPVLFGGVDLLGIKPQHDSTKFVSVLSLGGGPNISTSFGSVNPYFKIEKNINKPKYEDETISFFGFCLEQNFI